MSWGSALLNIISRGADFLASKTFRKWRQQRYDQKLRKDIATGNYDDVSAELDKLRNNLPKR